MTAVSTASAAWVQCAAIVAVATPLYLAFIFRNFAWKRIAQALSRAPRMSTAPDSNPSPESGASPFFMDTVEMEWPR